MAGISSIISICNGALFSLSSKGITSLADFTAPANTEETLCANGFAKACRVVLEQSPWACVQSRAELVETAPPLFDFSHAYSLPTDFVRINKIWLEDIEVGEASYGAWWKKESGKILTFAGSVQLEYNYFPTCGLDNKYAEVWDAYFALMPEQLKTCIEYQLALRLCMPMTENASLRAILNQEYSMALAEAMMMENKQSCAQNVYPTTLLDVRR